MATVRGPRQDGSPPKLLLVEGSDDVQVVRQLVAANLPDVRFEIWQRQGIDELLKAIPLQFLVQGRVALGILVDADDNLQFRWNDVVDKLRVVGVDLPDQPEPTGTIVETTPRIGVWVMPDNQANGQLEDFIRRMIPDSDPIWPLSEAYIDGIRESDRKFRPTKILRAKVGAWLATRERPRPIWFGIERGDLELEDNSEAFLNWLRRLFGDELA